ncbi:MAG: phosphatase PAP2 family protein [Thermoleophilia bacterium]
MTAPAQPLPAPGRPSLLARAWSARWPLWSEILLFLVLFVAYEWLRDMVAVDDPARPLRHALDIVDIEKALGLFIEPDVQDIAHATAFGEFVTKWFYTLAYTAGFTIMFVFVWFRRRAWFPVFRNWFWITNFLAVVGYWIYPLAPPRLTDLNLEDPTKATLTLGGALDWFQPFRNEFAAMPSMHVGQSFLFGLTLFWLLRPSRLRWLAWIWPAFMLFTVMATANHWWMDGVGGVITVSLGLLVATLLAGDMRRPWERARGPS